MPPLLRYAARVVKCTVRTDYGLQMDGRIIFKIAGKEIIILRPLSVPRSQYGEATKQTVPLLVSGRVLDK